MTSSTSPHLIITIVILSSMDTRMCGMGLDDRRVGGVVGIEIVPVSLTVLVMTLLRLFVIIIIEGSGSAKVGSIEGHSWGSIISRCDRVGEDRRRVGSRSFLNVSVCLLNGERYLQEDWSRYRVCQSEQRAMHDEHRNHHVDSVQAYWSAKTHISAHDVPSNSIIIVDTSLLHPPNSQTDQKQDN